MSRHRKTVLQMLFLLLLMGLTFYMILRGRDLRIIWELILSTRKRYLVLATLSMLLYIFCGGWCLRILFRGLGQHMSIWKCFKYSFVEFYFSAITPSSTGGQPVQLVYMKKDGYSFSDSSVFVLTVTALYKTAFLLLILVFFTLNAGFMADKIHATRFLFYLGLFLNVVLIAALCFLLFSKRLIHSLSAVALKLLEKLHFLKNAEKKIRGLDEKLAQYNACAHFIKSHPQVVLRTFLILLLQRLSILVVPYLVYRAFGLHGYSAIQIISIQLLLNLCVDMIPIPGAVGISEKVFLILFGPIFGERFLYSAVLISRGISFYLMVFLSGVMISGVQLLDILNTKRHNKNDITPGGTTRHDRIL